MMLADVACMNQNEKSTELNRHRLVRCQCDTPSPMDAGVHDATYCTECYAWLSPICRGQKMHLLCQPPTMQHICSKNGQGS